MWPVQNETAAGWAHTQRHTNTHLTSHVGPHLAAGWDNMSAKPHGNSTFIHPIKVWTTLTEENVNANLNVCVNVTATNTSRHSSSAMPAALWAWSWHLIGPKLSFTLSWMLTQTIHSLILKGKKSLLHSLAYSNITGQHADQQIKTLRWHLCHRDESSGDLQCLDFIQSSDNNPVFL